MKNKFLKLWEFIKKISIPDIVFVITILVLMIIPNTKFDKADYDFIEKRPLAAFPKLIKMVESTRSLASSLRAFIMTDLEKERFASIKIYL